MQLESVALGFNEERKTHTHQRPCPPSAGMYTKSGVGGQMFSPCCQGTSVHSSTHNNIQHTYTYVIYIICISPYRTHTYVCSTTVACLYRTYTCVCSTTVASLYRTYTCVCSTTVACLYRTYTYVCNTTIGFNVLNPLTLLTGQRSHLLRWVYRSWALLWLFPRPPQKGCPLVACQRGECQATRLWQGEHGSASS